MHRSTLFLLVVLVLRLTESLHAQNYTTTQTATTREKKSYAKANSYMDLEDYTNAVKELEKLTKKNPYFINAHLLLADSYRRIKNYTQAKTSFHKALTLNPDYEPKVYYVLGKITMEEKDYAVASKHFEKFLSYDEISDKLKLKANKYKADAKFRSKAMRNPVKFKPQNMGPNINGASRDYFPSITADESLFIYTRQIGLGRSGQEDLYMSIKQKGIWQKSVSLPINTDENEAAQNISADGKLLVFTVCNRREDFGSCDLYYSENVNGRWTSPRNLGPNINSKYWESQPSVAPNGEAIYYTRGGTRGQGNKNLLVSYRQADGTWGKPQQLKSLNTSFDESAPYIHPDGKTLYFSSNGHAGMGDLDLFASKLQEDGTWGKPINLGYPINTEEAEESVSVSLSGKRAFLASNRRGGYGSLDIYTFELPEEVRPNPVTYVKAIVYDAETRKRLNTKTKVSDLHANKTILNRQTDDRGEFLICLPAGVDYSLHVEKEGYLFHSESFALRKDTTALDKPYILEIPLIRIKSNREVSHSDKKETVITLKNVFFSSNSAELKSISRIELNKLSDLLKTHPQLRIELRGHTDNRGELADNQELSERRALAVKSYLERQGIEGSRMETKGFGESQAIDTNDTEEGRANNRRTEFVILPFKLDCRP